MHADAPAKLYCPTGHGFAELLPVPAGQAYPAVQLPLQLGLVLPVVEPNLPAGHGVHADAPPAVTNCPSGHGAHTALPYPAL